jgi:hypothetical protein
LPGVSQATKDQIVATLNAQKLNCPSRIIELSSDNTTTLSKRLVSEKVSSSTTSDSLHLVHSLLPINVSHYYGTAIFNAQARLAKDEFERILSHYEKTDLVSEELHKVKLLFPSM